MAVRKVTDSCTFFKLASTLPPHYTIICWAISIPCQAVIHLVLLCTVKLWQAVHAVAAVNHHHVCRNAEEFESERLTASMRADKAETSAIAAQHELIDVTKR